MGAKVNVKCIRCSSRGRVRVNGSRSSLRTYTCGACRSVFTEEALRASAREEEARLGGL